MPGYFEHAEVFERRNQRETLWIINLLYDSVPVQKSKKVEAAILECRFQQVRHPPYWLAPSDYFYGHPA